MIQQLAISAFLFTLFAFTFYAVFHMHNSKSNAKAGRNKIMIWFLCYLGAVAALTIIPLRESKTTFDNSLFNFIPVMNTARNFRYLNKINEDYWTFRFYENLLGNIIMFVPFGIFLPVLFKKKLFQVFLIAAFCSLLIETIQYLNHSLGYYRYVDVDDVILNTFGAALGYWIFKAFFNVGKHRRI